MTCTHHAPVMNSNCDRTLGITENTISERGSYMSTLYLFDVNFQDVFVSTSAFPAPTLY